MQTTFNNVKYIAKQINGQWRYREVNGAGANGWKYVRLATVDNPGLANALLERIAACIR